MTDSPSPEQAKEMAELLTTTNEEAKDLMLKGMERAEELGFHPLDLPLSVSQTIAAQAIQAGGYSLAKQLHMAKNMSKQLRRVLRDSAGGAS